jgi:WD40-like Beta Propeller Repeat
MKIHLLLLAAVLLVGCGEPVPQDDFPLLTGDYFGQTLPGNQPELFAPGLISDGMLNRDVTMTADGDEIYYVSSTNGYRYAAIMWTRRINDRWTKPAVLPFAKNPDWLDIEPCLTPDGSKFFFLSNRPLGEAEVGNSDIWAADRLEDGWGEPYNLGAPINTEAQEFYPSLTNDGTLYFTRADPETFIHVILRSRLVDGVYQEPELLPEQVNCGRNRFNAFVSPDESYVIVPVAGMPDTRGGVDYYITFRDEQDNWTEPLNMGDRVNSQNGAEWSASVSPDGRFLFFMSARRPGVDEDAPVDYAQMKADYNNPQNGSVDLYWMSAAVIDELRAQAHQSEEGGHE